MRINAGVKRKLHALGRWLARTRCKPLLVLTLLCLVFQEQYPLSDFPMYSSFTSRTSYLYLADGKGEPIPIASAAGMRTSVLKKVFESATRKERNTLQPRPKRLSPEQTRAVGEQVLWEIKESPAARQAGGLPQVLRLYEVRISLEEGRFEKRTELIAEMR